MTVSEYLGIASIGLLLITGVVHSLGGEIYLLRPLFKNRGNRVLDNDLARLVLRFAWHVTSLMWFLLAVILYAVVFSLPSADYVTLMSVGTCFLFVGVFDLVVSRGRHIGWPLLTLIGLSSFMAAQFLN